MSAFIRIRVHGIKNHSVFYLIDLSISLLSLIIYLLKYNTYIIN